MQKFHIEYGPYTSDDSGILYTAQQTSSRGNTFQIPLIAAIDTDISLSLTLRLSTLHREPLLRAAGISIQNGFRFRLNIV